MKKEILEKAQTLKYQIERLEDAEHYIEQAIECYEKGATNKPYGEQYSIFEDNVNRAFRRIFEVIKTSCFKSLLSQILTDTQKAIENKQEEFKAL